MTPETREIIDKAIEIAILKSHSMKPDWMTYHEREDSKEFQVGREERSNILKGIEEIKKSNFDRGEQYAKNVNELTKITSHNSGQIIALWESMEKEQKATALIRDIASAGRITKWIAFLIITCGAVYSAIKTGFVTWLVTILK